MVKVLLAVPSDVVPPESEYVVIVHVPVPVAELVIWFATLVGIAYEL